MPNEIRTKFDAIQSFTITMASLASSLADIGRQSDLIDNSNNRPAAMVYIKLKSGAAPPTLGAIYRVHLLRADTTTPNVTTDNAGPSDAAITIENSKLLGAIVVTATASKDFAAAFDTAPLGPLGPRWGIAIVNESGQALSAVEADHVLEYSYYLPEIQ